MFMYFHAVQVLFTTETFAMGLNMPARTVIFTTLQKFDGSAKRFVTSGEYIQMSGRAGRRGKDTHGTCIVIAEDDLDAAKCEEITFGKPSPLKSSFKLSYYTLLNLMRRVEGGTEGLEYVISNSFQQFQQNQRRPEVRRGRDHDLSKRVVTSCCCTAD
jgi:ATP-dependent RNA helicase DOB1